MARRGVVPASMGPIAVLWDNTALKLIGRTDPRARAGLDLLAAASVREMKRRCPVSAVQPVYASPVPLGRSTGPTYQGRGLARPRGPARPRIRYQGDLPLRPSGFLRNSIKAFRLADGSIIVGPTAPYSKFVNNDTRPHTIRSHGSWPLRNRATGQVFGPVVHHPGTRGAHFIEGAAQQLNGKVWII